MDLRHIVQWAELELTSSKGNSAWLKIPYVELSVNCVTWSSIISFFCTYKLLNETSKSALNLHKDFFLFTNHAHEVAIAIAQYLHNPHDSINY